MVKKSKTRSICPITKNEVVRDAAAKQVESIRDAFPRGIAAPALRALASAELRTLESLTTIRETELSQLHGMGPKAIGILKTALNERGMSFAK